MIEQQFLLDYTKEKSAKVRIYGSSQKNNSIVGMLF